MCVLVCVFLAVLPFLLNGWGTGHHDQAHAGGHRFETDRPSQLLPDVRARPLDFTSVDFVAEETAFRNSPPRFNTSTYMLFVKV